MQANSVGESGLGLLEELLRNLLYWSCLGPVGRAPSRGLQHSKVSWEPSGPPLHYPGAPPLFGTHLYKESVGVHWESGPVSELPVWGSRTVARASCRRPYEVSRRRQSTALKPRWFVWLLSVCRNMYLYICTCIHIYTYVYIYTHTYMNACIHASTHPSIHSNIH